MLCKPAKHFRLIGISRYEWFKDGKRLKVDGYRIAWEKQFQSGNIIINNARDSDQGYYQCHASNIFGTAVSNKLHVQIGGNHLFGGTIKVI